MTFISVSSDPKKLALRAGNEKEEGETADTVGCCSLRVEHITLHEQLDGNECVVEFDFLGKDSIRYYNKVPVIKKVKAAGTQTGLHQLDHPASEDIYTSQDIFLTVSNFTYNDLV